MMKNWEDIIKDKLAGYESVLPEGSFAEFRARRESTGIVQPRRNNPIAWIIASAVAAGLATVLLLNHSGNTEEGGESLVAQAAATETPVAREEMASLEPSQESLAESQVPPRASSSRIPSASVPLSPSMPSTPSVLPTPPTPQASSTQPAQAEPGGNTEALAVDPVITESEYREATAILEERNEETATSAPEEVGGKSVWVKVGETAGVIAGSGLAAVLQGAINGTGNTVEYMDPTYGMSNLAANPIYQRYAKTDNSDNEDILTGDCTHHAPIRLGLSTRIPVSDRLDITTGLEYSLYSSKFTFSLSGEKEQLAHYLGIPVRLDWTLASGRWLDVYAGGGAIVDYCIGATLGGQRIEGDGLNLSLLGAGGIQFNITPALGLYLEPELTWTIPSGREGLVTYRTRNPLMFSLATGLRINIFN
ncbi:MAG: hypothetical protein IK145_03305 [Bacteroidales bacterium]|nr:hypothetical protein [Bacteroidales bacterium]